MFESSLTEAGDRVGGDDRVRRRVESLKWRLATPADIAEFYGAVPGETLRAAVITLDERVVGIIGLARSRYAVRLFSEHKPELVPHLSSVTVWRAVKRVMQMVAECPCPVYVISSDSKLMQRLGFFEVLEGVWRN